MKQTLLQNKPIALLALFSAIGLANASYLTFLNLFGRTAPCAVTGQCDRVLTSVYSHIGPIPIALLGTIYFIATLVLILLYLDKQSVKILKILTALSIMASFVSLILIGIQLIIIKAMCYYCLLSAFITFLITGTEFEILKVLRKTAPQNSIKKV